ncbi:hypothetical protein CLV49_0608 [Labedella gwakjiensis]|uniref:Uncharacterized protein n=1 Tax=Labedella gwakjiensis TaxID=390269 RepID=A0A2P8GSS3_9MICO|nr:hypothetical protein [Labedella gwakjiensis]PSL37005.1 hypothetical protein CLV49_0608 [Labedella gwakjiensis]RUQ81836.1 hypothetical protein ELQ93_17565 [Labedella gwakjiensis]
MTEPETPSPSPETSGATGSLPAPPNRRRTAIIVGSIAAGVVLLGGITAAVVASSAAQAEAEAKEKRAAALVAERDAALDTFRDAKDACGLTAQDGVSITDEGQTMTIDNSSLAFLESIQAATIDEVFCVLDEVGGSSATRSLMESTRALDGRQTDEWDTDWGSIEVSWSYHPDDGLDTVWELELSDELSDLDD